MSLRRRWRRSLAHRGLAATVTQVPKAALRPAVLAVRCRRDALRAGTLVAAADPALLHLGSGPERLAGWLNVDLYFPAELCCDLRRPLPLPAGCVDAIYSQHFLEHLDKRAGMDLVRECARVLKPGGWLRLATPDLAYAARGYLSELPVAGDPAAGLLNADRLNDPMRAHDHRYLYDRPSLLAVMAWAGLVESRREAPQVSRCAWLTGRETRVGPGDVAEAHLIIEGRKP